MYNIKILHIEPTDVCQAACPLCARETDVDFNKDQQHHLTVDQLINAVGEQTLAKLDKAFFCGNYGDPAAAKHTVDISKYLRSINPAITLGMNTNGGLRNASWWSELGSIFNQPLDYVVWSIDGLEDTNHIYRINTEWDKIITNAQAFINAGGSAHWDMLVYSHNQHQLDEAQQLAKQMGFTWFRAKVSKRTSNISWLTPPKGSWQLPVTESATINCMALNESSAYISARGHLSPCCWLGHNSEYDFNQFDSIKATWGTDDCNPVCRKTCGQVGDSNNFLNQWQRNVAF